jgi:RNase P subunit RPR2
MRTLPITKKKFDGGKLHSTVEEEILSFLRERKEGAFTSQEIMAGMRYPTDFSTPEISRMSTFAIADFTTFLHDLMRRRIIRMKVVSNRMYYTVMDSQRAKCPKCNDLFEPKKTWKMAGRPDKKGKRFQLHIGLYKCPKHGTFRKVLDKRKI